MFGESGTGIWRVVTRLWRPVTGRGFPTTSMPPLKTSKGIFGSFKMAHCKYRENYWVFDAERQIRGPESIRTLGLSVSGIQAALRWGHDSNYNTYFFKAGSYWRFSPRENRVESVFPRSMQDWRGIPEDVDAAFRDIYGYAHFIRGRQYWKFDPVGMNSLEGYPRYIGMDFFGCRNV